jgi:TetR/AcrR family transcriptional repressor of mexJK operon
MSTNSSDHVFAIDAPKRGRGRPRDLKKRKAILDAASALFLERGIAATTVEAVAERASVSKMTVYSHFPDKPALLAAVFDRNLSAIELPKVASDEDIPAIDRLSEFGVRLVLFLTRPEIVRSSRFMAASAHDYPELAAAFYEAGPATVLRVVAACLESARDREKLNLPDAAVAAEQLVSAWLGVDQLKQSLGVGGPPTPETVSRRVRSATQAFLRGWSSPGAVSRPRF